jgi:ADP-heptose:LPS heptosyltransferase
MKDKKNILIIRLGALGDILLCMKPFQDIRRDYPDARITLLTTPSFADFTSSMPWLDRVMTDTRPSWWRLREWIALSRKLRSEKFDLVFDLQNKPRTNLYYTLFFKGHADWSGTAKDCSHPRPAITEKMHRQEEMLLQMRSANVRDSGPLNLDWLQGDLTALTIPRPYAVLVPGCSPHLTHKRWPPAHYAALAQELKKQGLSVVAVGTKADAEAIAALRQQADFVQDLSGKTSLHQLGSVFRAARLVVGNDTGPTFLSAMVNAPTLALLSHHTDPVLSGPRGERCAYLKKETISDLSPQEVWEKARSLASL